MLSFLGEKGSADTARDPRGFAVKFYTEEGVLYRIYSHICWVTGFFGRGT
jgi:catalase